MHVKPVSMSRHHERRLHLRANFDVHEPNDSFALGREHNEPNVYGREHNEVNNHVVNDNSWHVQDAQGEWLDKQPEHAQQDPNYIDGAEHTPHCLQALGPDQALEKTFHEQGLSLRSRL